MKMIYSAMGLLMIGAGVLLAIWMCIRTAILFATIVFTSTLYVTYIIYFIIPFIMIYVGMNLLKKGEKDKDEY